MSTTVTFNGANYTVPAVTEETWGDNVSNYLIAIAQGCLQNTGGNFTLSADANFGGTFGLLAKYFKTRTVLPATTGLFRGAVSDTIAFRNNANTGNLILSIDASDVFQFNSSLQSSATITASAMSATTANFTTATIGTLNATLGVVTATTITADAFISSSANTASTGLLRFASTNTIKWRNNANSADITFGKDTSDQLTWAGTSFLSSAGVLLAAASPALTGDVTKPLASLTTTVAAIAGTVVGGTSGSGNVAFTTSPTFVTPVLGVAAATTITANNFISSSANTASAGLLRFANTNTIRWRNFANSADIALAVDTSDQLSWAGTSFLSATGVLLAAASPAYTGDVTTSAGNLTTTVAKIAGTTVSGTSGSGNVAFTTSPTFTTPVLGAASGTSLSLSGQFTSTLATGTAPLVVTSTTRVANLNVATAGAADTVTTNANLTGVITSVGNATSIASQTGTGTKFVVDTNPTLVGPALGTPTALVGTNITGTALGLTAGNVTTNANLTGVITSVGNATSIASQTGTGTKFVVDTSPTLVTPNIGVATATTITADAFISSSANTASTGLLRFASTNTIKWRNNANSADITFGKDTSDQLTWAGVSFLSASGVLLAAAEPAHTGDVTNTAGSLATTVAKIAGTTVSGTSGSGNVAFTTSPVFTTPALGTPSALVGTNITGTAASLTAGNVTTNANMTGPITGTGNVTSITAQTGTGTTFVMSAGPTITGTTTHSTSTSGAVYEAIFAQNTSNTAASDTRIKITNGGSSGGSVYVNYLIQSTISWSAGVDTTNSNGFTIAAATGLGSNRYFVINSSGGVTLSSLSGTGSRAVNADANGLLSAASDSRLKTEIKNADLPGLKEILKLQPRAYKWLSDIERRGDKAVVEIGFFADEVAPIIPSAAPMGSDGYYGFYDRSVTAALVKAIKELKAEFEEYKKTVLNIYKRNEK